jgi:hypothetical protein
MKTKGRVEVEIHEFLTSVLVGGIWSVSRSNRFTSGERAPGTHWIVGLVGLITGLDLTRTWTPTPWPSSPYPVAAPIVLSQLLTLPSDGIKKYFLYIRVYFTGAGGSVVGWGTMLQAGRSRVRVLIRWILLIYLILPAALWPLSQLSL